VRPKKYHTIKFTITETIGHLVIDQPPSNKMTLVFFSELVHLVRYLRKEEEIKGLVISGNGRHFSSGTDLQALLNAIEQKTVFNDSGRPVCYPGFLAKNYSSLQIMERLPFPVVAAIQGVCLGSAMELALFSHFRFCSEDAVFGLPESTFNLIPGLGGIIKVAHLSGKARAMEMIMRGKTFPASEALRLGLVDQIISKKELISSSFMFARSVSSGYRIEKRNLLLRKYFK